MFLPTVVSLPKRGCVSTSFDLFNLKDSYTMFLKLKASSYYIEEKDGLMTLQLKA